MVLERILETKRVEVHRAKSARAFSLLIDGLARSQRNFEGALRGGRTRFILECKRRSPSEGEIRKDYDPAAIARAVTPFADVISVLTDGPFFGGSLEDLRRAREATERPILRKDFILEPYQVVEARVSGADAVLLMLSVLDDRAWRDCMRTARELGMGALTEIHSEDELARAVALGATVIGINSRNLRTLEVDLGVIGRLAPLVPKNAVLVAESGIQGHGDIVALRGNVDAFLVGTSLMRRPDLDAGAREITFGTVKVCGLTRPEDARAAWETGASWGGIVFAPGSPRRIDISQARAIRAAAPLLWAGVFVDAPPGLIAEIARDLRLDAVQLHGEESPESVRALRGLLRDGCEIWKAIRVRHDVPRLAETAADRLLLDAWRDGIPGGTGERFDWSIARCHPDRERIVLAGGLRPDNVLAAEAAGAGMLDVSSGVEESPGIKSRARLEQFFSVLRGTGRELR